MDTDGGLRPGPGRTVWRWLVGPPLRARDLSRERITPVEGLSALSLDAITSVAYGPEAIVLVLAGAGSGALGLVLPITVAIVLLLAILVVSYRQVIEAFPAGGGAYAVTRATFGRGPSLVAAAALVVDYVLTVAVSVAAGVGALTSAFPSLAPSTVPLCLAVLAVVTVFNLRGLGEAARAFLLPTMVFVVGLLAILAVGLVHPFALHQPQPGRSLLPVRPAETLGVLLVLKAFSAGCSALTGVEAIANGVPLFREPRVARAKRTEAMLGGILAAMLLGLAVLARRWHVAPRSGQTVLSQIMGMAIGRHWAYFVVSMATTVVLALAANTSFGGLPVLASLLARDDHLPHLFGVRGDRQVYAAGIWVLAALSAVLLVAVGGNTQSLIPLFAVGVFTGFTFAQAGLVVHWRRSRPPRWRRRAAVNGTGAAVTAVATVIFVVTKFTAGAWVVVIAVPAFVVLFRRVATYYASAGTALGNGTVPPVPERRASTVVVPVTAVNRLTSLALSEALSIGDEVVAVSVVPEGDGAHGEDHATALQAAWDRWVPGVPLRVLRTEYASVVVPLMRFIDERRSDRRRQVVVLIPVVVPRRLRHRLLHNHLDVLLTAALRRRPDVVVARVGFRLDAPAGQLDRVAPADPAPADGMPATGTGRRDRRGPRGTRRGRGRAGPQPSGGGNSSVLR